MSRETSGPKPLILRLTFFFYNNIKMAPNIPYQEIWSYQQQKKCLGVRNTPEGHPRNCRHCLKKKKKFLTKSLLASSSFQIYLRKCDWSETNIWMGWASFVPFSPVLGPGRALLTVLYVQQHYHLRPQQQLPLWWVDIWSLFHVHLALYVLAHWLWPRRQEPPSPGEHLSTQGTYTCLWESWGTK